MKLHTLLTNCPLGPFMTWPYPTFDHFPFQMHHEIVRICDARRYALACFRMKVPLSPFVCLVFICSRLSMHRRTSMHVHFIIPSLTRCYALHPVRHCFVLHPVRHCFVLHPVRHCFVLHPVRHCFVLHLVRHCFVLHLVRHRFVLHLVRHCFVLHPDRHCFVLHLVRHCFVLHLVRHCFALHLVRHCFALHLVKPQLSGLGKGCKTQIIVKGADFHALSAELGTVL